MGSMIKPCTSTVSKKNQAVSAKPPRIPFGEKLTRNVLAASLLLACVVSARDIALSPEKNVLTVLQDAAQSEWDENIGKLVYANSTLSQAISVFSPQTHSLCHPCSAEISDIFSKDAPYIVYQPSDSIVSAASCEVTGVSYSPESGYIVRTYCSNGLECLYSGLSSCCVSEGDELPACTKIGSCGENPLIFEVRENHRSVDASVFFPDTQVQ